MIISPASLLFSMYAWRGAYCYWPFFFLKKCNYETPYILCTCLRPFRILMEITTSSASINGILQCGLGGQKLYNGKKETFWVKCGLNADLFQSFCGLMSSYIHQNFERSLKSAYLRNYTFRDKSLCVHYGRTNVYNPRRCMFKIHPILPAFSQSSCLFVTFNCAI